MSVTLVTTPAASNANSYATEAEATAYFAARVPLNPPWVDALDPTASLAMATRLLDAYGVPHTTVRYVNGAYYQYTSRAWTGTVATDTQALAWPRIGMYDSLGRPIPSDTIPQELKDAQAELAGQLTIADTTLDNSVIVGGITSVKAGSVAVTFKDMIERHVLPSIVLEMLPGSWFTDEIIVLTGVQSALFDVVSE